MMKTHALRLFLVSLTPLIALNAVAQSTPPKKLGDAGGPAVPVRKDGPVTPQKPENTKQTIPAAAQTEQTGANNAPEPKQGEVLQVPPSDTIKAAIPKQLSNPTQDEIARFCRNIDNKAQDARFELQLRQLNSLRAEVDDRIKVLEEKRKEYEDWLTRRNAFLAKTQDSFVAIISKMRPDAAAAQLTLVDDVAAASIILKLEPRISSAIMNELPPEKSANLTRVLVSAQKVPSEKPETLKPVKATPR